VNSAALTPKGDTSKQGQIYGATTVLYLDTCGPR